MKTKLILTCFLIAALLSTCNNNVERPFQNSLNNVRYGEIHKMGGGLMISIEGYDNLPVDSILNFLHCLKKLKDKNNSHVEAIEVYRHYYYIDQIKPSQLLLRVYFKDYFDQKSGTIHSQIATVEKIENNKTRLLTHYTDAFECENK